MNLWFQEAIFSHRAAPRFPFDHLGGGPTPIRSEQNRGRNAERVHSAYLRRPDH